MMNLFQPSVKLLRSERVGSKLRRVYDALRTPLERLQACAEADPRIVADEQSSMLRAAGLAGAPAQEHTLPIHSHSR